MSEKLKRALNALKRQCFRVIPDKPGFNEKLATEVRFAGPSYAEAGEKAPVCDGCGKPLSFIFQFRPGPDEKKSTGPLHCVFYCFNCMPIGRPEEEKGQWLVRVYDTPTLEKFAGGTGVNKKLTPCSCSLTKVANLPDYETLENHYPEVAALCEEIDGEDPISAYEEAGVEIGCEMEPFTSIGGYPIWIQGEGTQVCPVCGKDAEFVAQIDSESGAGLMWGDAGCLYIFCCPDHKDGFAIEMQCF
jgi:hypothetical protein